MLVCILVFLTGCVVTNEDAACIGWLPVHLDQKDYNVISSSLARDILKSSECGKHLYRLLENQFTKSSRELLEGKLENFIL
nr:hypothetical protein [Bartonella capreoli]